MSKANGSRKTIFVKRKRTLTLTLGGVAALFVLASVVTEYDLAAGILSLPKAFGWIGRNLVPDAKAWSRLPNILDKLTQTALLSVAVTVIAGLCAFFFSLMGSKTTQVNGLLAKVVRIVAAFFRNVPDVVWAILLLFSFGQNILTGFFALFFATFGMLTATGIGYLFDLYYKRLDYASASLVVLSIVVLVILIEIISSKIRKVIM